MTLILVTIYLLSLLPKVYATCYFPNGNAALADVACNAAASDSFCCYSNQACLSNGLCVTGEVDGVQQYARGTCTDQTWQSGACPNFCINQEFSGNAMMSCNVTGVDSYCCNEGCSCGSTYYSQGSYFQQEVRTFTGTPYTITVIGQTSTYPNPSATTVSSSHSNSAGTSTSTTSTSSSTRESSSSPTATSDSSTSSSSTTNDNKSNKTALGAGIGIGLGVALVLTGIGGFFLYRRRRRLSQINREVSTQEKVTSELPPYNASKIAYYENGLPSITNQDQSTNQHLHVPHTPNTIRSPRELDSAVEYQQLQISELPSGHENVGRPGQR